MASPITTVLFDLDGTLLDSIRLIIDSYHHALAVHGLPARTDEAWLAGIGTPLRVQFGDWAEEPALFEALIETYRDFNIANHDARVSGYPGVVETVIELRRRGLRTGLVTSKQKAGAERGLRFLKLDGAMEVVIAADDVVNPKPHPEPLLLASKRLQTDPAATIYVGDSVHDMKSGRAAGMRTAAALWGPFTRDDLRGSRPDYWLEAPADLLTVIGGA